MSGLFGGGAKAPQIGDPLAKLPFQGINTGSFSLRRAQPAVSARKDPFGPGGFESPGGINGINLDIGRKNFEPGISGQSSRLLRQTPATAGSGPFELIRTDQTVPEAEKSLLGQTQQLRPVITSAFAQNRERLEGLLAETKPGFGNLTRARVEAIDRNRSRTLGNLREAFGKRNVLGSSFAQAEIRSADREFTQMEEAARAEAAVQEIELSQNLISNIGNLDAQGFALLSDNMRLELQQIVQIAQRELEELRIAGTLTSGHEQIAANLALNQAQLQGQANADQGSLFGTLVGAGATLGAAAFLGPATPEVVNPFSIL